ncbi:ABC transporter permease [Leucobacter soli]|uniref:ABC transporter permease n=1 Tax=Leucobacter soli TaxID=2812850 RepID=UPI003617F148
MTAPVNLPNNPTVPIKVVRPTKPKSILRRMARTWQGRVGMLLGAFILALIFLGPFFAPYDPQALAVGSPLEGPSAKHWLGTDNLGRDVLSRLMNGGVNIILLPVIIVLLSFLIGGVPGIIAGYKRGAFDTIVTRVFDILLTLPRCSS